MSRSASHWLGCLLLGLSPCAAFAGEEELFFAELPTVYSVSRMPQAAAEAPGSVTVIDREMIRTAAARTIPDLLRLVPGFQVTSRNIEMPARATYHGLSNDDFSPRLQVLIDGRSQYSALFRGGVNWDALPVALEDIERIEVVRGTNVVSYGTNAFLGVVNIITTDAALTRGTTLASQIGSNGLHDEFLRWGGKVGAADLRLSYRQQADNGLRYTQQANDQADMSNRQQNGMLDIRADVSVSSRDDLSLRIGKINTLLDVGRTNGQAGDTYMLMDPPRNARNISQFVQASWEHRLQGGDTLKVSFAHTEDEIQDRYFTQDPTLLNTMTGGNLSTYLLDNSGKTARDELELQHALTLTPAMRLTWGLGAKSEWVTSAANFYQGTQDNQTERIFGNFEWRPDAAWLLNLGGSYDHNRLNSDRFSPRISLSRKLDNGQTVRAGISRAYRFPSLYEQAGYSNFGVPYIANTAQTTYQANGDVQPEELTTYEIGYYAEIKPWHSSIDVRLFQETIPNRIQIVNLTTVNTNGHYATNAESVTIRGLEYQWRWQPLPATRLVLNQTLATIDSQRLDYVSTDSTTDQARMDAQTRSSMPDVSTALMLMQKLPRNMDLSISVTSVNAMRWAPNSAAEPYTRVDWRLGYPFQWHNTRGEVAWSVQNATGSHYEFRPSNPLDRVQWLSLRLDL